MVERMTEKRFTLKGLIDGVPNVCDDGVIIEQEDVVDLLNAQHEENQQLKQENKELQFAYDECSNNKLFSRRKLETENKNLKDENQQLKAQLYNECEEGVCHICKHRYLVKHQDMGGYYIQKCEKGHEECSKKSLRHCEDFKFKEGL